jgi:glycogen(starch) synthase
MRICIYSRTFAPAIGGLERIAEMLAAEFSRAGHAVEVVTDTQALAQVGYPFKVTRTNRFWKRVEAFKQADIVLFMSVSLRGLSAAAMTRRPAIFSHQTGYDGTGVKASFLAWLKRQACLFYPNICCSAYIAGRLPGRCAVVPNSYDVQQFSTSTTQAKGRDFVFCGRLVSDKGMDLGLQAFAKVCASIPDATLTVIGDGPERPALQALASELQVAQRVRFMGALRGAALAAELRDHACMVVPSNWEEPFGIVALEGVACCNTVIVTNRGGLPEAVGPCGMVVESSVAGLHTAMLLVAEARRLGGKLPGQADAATRTAHLRRHRPDVVASQYLLLLETAAGKPTQGIANQSFT